MSESFSSTIFATLDAPFINFEKNVEPIIWQSKDILIMQTYDFKIPTMLGSLVKYSFSTTGGDINFSTEFHVPGQVFYCNANIIKLIYMLELNLQWNLFLRMITTV